MKKNKIFQLSTAIILVIFAFTACEKVTTQNPGTNYTTASDYTSVLSIMDLDDLEGVTEEDNLKSASETDLLRCFEVIVHTNDDGSLWPRSWTFDYNTEACSDAFGVVKSGLIHFSLTDCWRNEGSLRTITYEDFYVNGNKLEGTRTILNTGLNDEEHPTFERTFAGSLTKGDTATMSWESNRQVEMIAGYDTFLFADDEYLVSGGATGTNFDGVEFTITITDPLYYKKCSLFPVSGSITIEVDGQTDIIIDYGDGECDNIAEKTIGDETTEVSLGYPCQTTI